VTRCADGTGPDRGCGELASSACPRLRVRGVSATDIGSVESSVQEVPNQRGDSVTRALQQKVPAVEQVNLRIHSVRGEGPRSGRSEDLIAAAPHRQHWYLTCA